MDRSKAAADALASPVGRRAVETGDAGTLIRLVREAIGMTQSDLGKEAGYSQPTICRLEKNAGRIAEIKVRARLADILSIPRSALGLATSAAEPAPQRTVSDMRRSQFLRGMVGAATSLALPVELSSDTKKRITMRTVRGCSAALDRLYELDERHGGATIYALATQMVNEIRSTLGTASYTDIVGTELRCLAAATAEHAGWLAFDAGRADDARRWWLEALHFADRAENADARVTALSSMALQACTSANPADGREAVDLMEVGRRSTRQMTPRLKSLMSARQAVGHAKDANKKAAFKAISEAEKSLVSDRPADDEPTWLHFWGPADLHCHRARAFLLLGDAVRAEEAALAAQQASDEALYPRNHTIYSALRARALVESGKIDEAIATATPVVARVSTLGSKRIVAEARTTVKLLGQAPNYGPAASFTSWANKLLQMA